MSKRSIKSFGIPWETVIPTVFLAASAACWYDPTKAPAIAFFMIGCAIAFFDSFASYFTKPAADALSKALTDAMLAFSDEENMAQTDRLLDALANSISRALQSSTLTSTAKTSLIEALSDDDLQSAAINTLQMAMKKAADNDDFKGVVLSIMKRSFGGALKDEYFIKDSIESGVTAMVIASQNEVLRQSMHNVVTQAVSDALKDEQLVAEFKEVIKGCLTDGGIYRSGATGIIDAATGINFSRAKSDTK